MSMRPDSGSEGTVGEVGHTKEETDDVPEWMKEFTQDNISYFATPVVLLPHMVGLFLFSR